MVAEAYGLSHLHVRKARHERVGFFRGVVHEHFLQMAEHGDDLINFGAQVQADVSGDLVVAATAGVQALARIADQLCQTRFDIEVNVFEFKLPEELAGLDLIGDLSHAASDIGQILFGNHAAGRKHLSVSKRPSDVGGRHALVKAHRLGISEHELGNGFGETTRPCFLLGMQRIG